MPLDSNYSSNWLEVDTRRAQRQAEIEEEIFVARLGEGPFGPEYPGAIYLNAVYRMDYEQIKRETDILTYSISHSQSKVSFFFTSSQVRRQFLGSHRGTSIVDPLIAFFIGSYYRHYPNCMEALTKVFTKTTYYRTITTSTFGGYYVSSETSQTAEYRVNQRHAKAFEYLDVELSTPGGLDMYMSLFGGSL